jgi:hypothetical protein
MRTIPTEGQEELVEQPFQPSFAVRDGAKRNTKAVLDVVGSELLLDLVTRGWKNGFVDE